MAMSVRYHSIDGEILYQSGVDGRIDYLPDALGNVTATTKPNQPGVIDNTYRYKPYGDRLAKTGTGIDPKYQWVGTRTYRDTGLAHSSHYMIARHYAEEEARWTTVDPLWPNEQSYDYVSANPVSFIDVYGVDRVQVPPPTGVSPASCQYWGGIPIPKPDTLSKCKACKNPRPVSPALLSCLFFKETRFGEVTGDELWGPGQLRDIAIRDLCSEHRFRDCLPDVLKRKIPDSILKNMKNCVNYIKGLPLEDLALLAVLRLQCLGLKAYGYGNPQYETLFKQCEDCVTKAVREHWRKCPNKIELPDCSECFSQMTAGQSAINKGLPLPK